MKERLSNERINKELSSVSTHAPVKERLSNERINKELNSVSTHAPVKERLVMGGFVVGCSQVSTHGRRVELVVLTTNATLAGSCPPIRNLVTDVASERTVSVVNAKQLLS